MNLIEYVGPEIVVIEVLSPDLAWGLILDQPCINSCRIFVPFDRSAFFHPLYNPRYNPITHLYSCTQMSDWVIPSPFIRFWSFL